MKKGFTLIEIILGVALIIAMGALTAPFGLSLYNMQINKSVTDEVYTALKKAQAYSTYRKGNDQYGIKFVGDNFVLFKGATYDAGETLNESSSLYSATTTFSISLPSAEISFATSTGLPSTSTKITVTSGNTSHDIMVCESGLIELGSSCGDIIDCSTEVASFDGSGDYVSVTHNSNLNASAFSGLTLSAWVYADSIGGGVADDPLIAKQESGVSNGYRIALGSSNEVRFSIKDASDHTVQTSDSPISLNQWHHVVGVWDGTTMKVYVDGAVNSTTNSYSGTPLDNSEDLEIAGFSGDGTYVDGYIANAAVFNDGLTAGEVSALYSQGYIPLSHEHLVSYWALDGDSADQAGTNEGTDNGDLTYVSDATRPTPFETCK